MYPKTDEGSLHPSNLPNICRTQLLPFALPISSLLLQSLQTQDVAGDLTQNIVSTILPAVENYFIPFPETAANVVEDLLRDLKNRTDAFHLDSSRAFQNLRDDIISLQPLLTDTGQDIASCIVTEKGDILDAIKQRVRTVNDAVPNTVVM